MDPEDTAAANLDRTWVLPDGSSVGLEGLLAWAATQTQQTVFLSLDADTPSRNTWLR